MLRQHQHFYPKNSYRPKSKASTQKKSSSLFDIHTSQKNSFYQKDKSFRRSSTIYKKNCMQIQAKNQNLNKSSKKFIVYHSENTQQSNLENVKEGYQFLNSRQSSQNNFIQYSGQHLSVVNKIRLNCYKKKTFRNNFVFINEKQLSKKQVRNDCQSLFVKSDKKQILQGMSQIYKYRENFMKIQKSNTPKKLIQESKKPQSQRQIRSKNWCQNQQKSKKSQKQNNDSIIANNNNGVNQNLINLSLSKAIKSRTKNQIYRSRQNKKMIIRPLELSNCNYEIQQKVKGWQIQLQDDYDFANQQ